MTLWCISFVLSVWQLIFLIEGSRFKSWVLKSEVGVGQSLSGSSVTWRRLRTSVKRVFSLQVERTCGSSHTSLDHERSYVFCLLVVLNKLSVLAKWSATKTPPTKANRGEGVVSIMPSLVHCWSRRFSDYIKRYSVTQTCFSPRWLYIS